MPKRKDQLKKRTHICGSAAGDPVKAERIFPCGFPVPKGHTARVNELLKDWKC